MRVPTINVSVVDLSFVAKPRHLKEEINAVVKAAAEGALKGVLGFNTKPLVSVDFNHDPRSSVYDATLTKVMGGTLVKVLSLVRQRVGLLQPHARHDAGEIA
jgi:glyceraldehyde 3-phosphate dehydrogenase